MRFQGSNLYNFQDRLDLGHCINTFTMYHYRYKSSGVNKGTVAIGKLGKDTSLLQWTDTAATALNGTEYIGFEVESGGNTEFGTVCFDVL